MNKISSPADLYTLQAHESTLNMSGNTNSKAGKYTPYSRLYPDADDIAIDIVEQNQLALKKRFDYRDKSLHTVIGYSDKSIQNLFHAVNTKRVITFPRFIYGLSIRYVGVKVASDIANHFRSYENLMDYIRDPSKGNFSVYVVTLF